MPLDSTPIIVGAGQFTEKDTAPEEAHPPMGIAAEAAKAALADTGIGARLGPLIDTLVVVRIFHDSTHRPQVRYPFGRAENPPWAVARRIGANPAQAVYSNVGGDTPQKLVNEMCERIAAGDVEITLLTGGEAIRTSKVAFRQGIELDWNEADGRAFEDRGIGRPLVTRHELDHGIGIPMHTYPLFENALRDRAGHGIEEHRRALGRLFEPFTEVAAANPYAFYGTRRTAEELATVTDKNRLISLSYPKWMNAMDGVNQGAALVLTSVGKAKELEIDPAKWVFVHGCAEAHEKILVSDRVNYYSSPAIKVNTGRAFDMAGISIDDIDFIDLYSCFPSAVEVACDALGLAYDDRRGLTVTGGLPFFGGPGNNYSMNAIASMTDRLRGKRGAYGLVTANGGYLSKHATGVYSTTPTAGAWRREAPASYQAEIDERASPVFEERPHGAASVETYAVCFGRNGPERAIVVGRLAGSDKRFVSNTPSDAATLKNVVEEEFLGRTGSVSHKDGINTFVPKA